MIGLNLANHGRVDDGIDHLRAAVALVADSPPSRQKAWAMTSLASGYILPRQGAAPDDLVRGLEIAHAAVAVARPLKLDDLHAEALMFIGLGKLFLDDPGGMEDIEQCLVLAEKGKSAQSILAYSNAAYTLDTLGPGERVVKLRAEVRRRAEELGVAFFLRSVAADGAETAYNSGHWADAVVMTEKLLHEAVSGKPILAKGRLHAVRGRIHIARGEPEEALTHGREAMAWVEQALVEEIVPAQAFLYRTLLAAGDLAEARTGVAATIELAGRVGSSRAAKGTGDLAYAAVAIGLVEEFLSLTRSLRIETTWCRAAVAIATGDFRRAADIYRDMGCLPDEAYARLQGGRKLLLEGGHQGEARHELDRALAFWRSVDATAYVRECELLIDEAATA
jgi:tetratricopeptide (TPR) repeat protein